ncbi:OmpH family outer membrane protein [Polaribacter tangerinus]|uniref:OmpH family outer membrane protein n=1 Tax=Polaribacter tangerinus TaxID=1920034 RepID=UPI000B4AA565|nr:OmpH family outer membrane protein [Polaribacter tangerinus]
MKLNIITLFISLICTITVAQNKVGTIDSDYIINNMPEAKKVVDLAKEYGAKLDSSFSIKVAEFKEKLDDYKQKESEMNDLEKRVIQSELSALDQDIQKYKKNGTTLMGLKRDELMRPLYKRLNDAIASVAKENGYSQIFTTTGNQFGYIDFKYDITDLVIKKLGIVITENKQE